MNIISEKWQTILDTVKNDYELSEVSFSTWLVPLKIHKFDEQNNNLYIYVPVDEMGISSDIGIPHINRKYTVPLKVAIAEITGITCDIIYIDEIQAEDDAVPVTNDDSDDSSFKDLLEKANLNPEYTFENFVVGGNNKFAHAASLAVAESPGKTYNPLFLYGGVGLGKTHLMHSIAHFILKKNPETRILYVTSEAFTIELIEAIRNGNNTAMSKFREKYRNIDALLIDDIQFIIGKESTQEEFFHTFNYLYGANKQIIITSDKPPKEMTTLDERFQSRFAWGLQADISSPDYETRMAILRKKKERDSKEKNYKLDDEVIEYIANNIKSNIRELEGALNRIVAMSSLEQKEITVSLAEEALKDMISPDSKKEITPDLILMTVAEHFHIKVEDIKGSKRSANIVTARQIAMYLCRDMINISLKEVGSFMGKRDHTTVLHGVEKIAGEIESSETMKNTVEIIKKKINPA